MSSNKCAVQMGEVTLQLYKKCTPGLFTCNGLLIFSDVIQVVIFGFVEPSLCQFLMDYISGGQLENDKSASSATLDTARRPHNRSTFCIYFTFCRILQCTLIKCITPELVSVDAVLPPILV